jgi:class 3 adenylate cyclase
MAYLRGVTRLGFRTRRLGAYLKKRLRAAPKRRPELDRRHFPTLFHKRAIVFTDTADFTVRTLRDGILHFLMLFERLMTGAEKALTRSGGEIVKVEADSLLIRFDDMAAACRGVEALEGYLSRLNHKLPKDERLRFSYGVGYGDVLDIDHDVFGLEVNLASKLGEDLARPGEVLLTPSAAAAMDGRQRRRLASHGVMAFGPRTIAVTRLKLPAR